jgi:predicted nucleic acid-binding protein
MRFFKNKVKSKDYIKKNLINKIKPLIQRVISKEYYIIYRSIKYII